MVKTEIMYPDLQSKWVVFQPARGSKETRLAAMEVDHSVQWITEVVMARSVLEAIAVVVVPLVLAGCGVGAAVEAELEDVAEAEEVAEVHSTDLCRQYLAHLGLITNWKEVKMQEKHCRRGNSFGSSTNL